MIIMTPTLSPISALNQAWQLSLCTRPTFKAGNDATGQSPNQVFECTCAITTAGDGRVVRHTGSGRSKGGAKTACAALVLEDLRRSVTPAQAALMGAVHGSVVHGAALPAAAGVAAVPAAHGAVGMHVPDEGSPRSHAVSAAVCTVLSELGLTTEGAATVAAAVLRELRMPDAGSQPAPAAVGATEAVRELLSGPLGMGKLAARIAGPMTILTSMSVPVYVAAGSSATKLVTVEGKRCPCATGALFSAMRELEAKVLHGDTNGNAGGANDGAGANGGAGVTIAGAGGSAPELRASSGSVGSDPELPGA
jgi:hypothetical protein